MTQSIENVVSSEQKEYASSILEYALEHNLNLKTYAENSSRGRKIWIWLTNNWGVPNISVMAELILFRDKIYYKPSKEKESEGIVKYLKEEFPEKVKRMNSKDF